MFLVFVYNSELSKDELQKSYESQQRDDNSCNHSHFVGLYAARLVRCRRIASCDLQCSVGMRVQRQAPICSWQWIVFYFGPKHNYNTLRACGAAQPPRAPARRGGIGVVFLPASLAYHGIFYVRRRNAPSGIAFIRLYQLKCPKSMQFF